MNDFASSMPDSGFAGTDGTPVQDEQQRTESQRLSTTSAQRVLTVPGYEVVACLGEGSFGSVWLARERKTGKLVAVKFFTHHRGLDWALLTREVEKLAVLDSSRDVVRLFDVGWDHDPPYFVMEYLETGSVASVLENGPLPAGKAVEIAKGIARALVHAHGAGILHCDIKPANILLDRGGQARLGDFGQSRLTTELSPALGTLFYMAPEQAALKAIPDARWDVYALGALMYHMLTGAPPYRTPLAEEQLRRCRDLAERLETYRKLIAQSPPPEMHRNAKGVDRLLADVIDGCLQRDPARRIPNAQVVLDQLERRDLQRARRPLIWLGLLGPFLLLFALSWIAGRAIPSAVTHAEQALYERALASDAAAVKILAASIQQEVSDRQYELEELAKQLVGSNPQQSPFGFRADFEQVLDAWKAESDRRLVAQQRTVDESLFLTDAQGFQRYRSPRNETIGDCFAYRDYFHALGRELSPGDDLSHIQPRRASGVSMPFRSRATGQYMVAVATPVWDGAQERVIGVLARTVHLSDLLSQWEERIRVRTGNHDAPPADDLFLSLVDTREQPPILLDHRWMTREHLEPIRDDAELKRILQLSPRQVAAIQTTDRNAHYLDPLAETNPLYEGPWLAAFALVGEIGWIAIVQERRTRVIAPMAELYDVFFRYGLWTLFVFCAVVVLLWWLIQRAANGKSW